MKFGSIVGQIYRLGAKIADVHDQEVYAGTSVETGEDVAIKLEYRLTRKSSCNMDNELKAYRVLKGGGNCLSMKVE